MRKREWIRCKDAERMLRDVAWLWTDDNDRRLRLFTLTAGRRLWERLDVEVCRRAIEVAWRHAEGTATAEEAVQACDALRPVLDEAFATDAWEFAHLVRVILFLFRYPESAALELLTPSPLGGGEQPAPLLTPEEINACCGLLRDIFGDRGYPVTPDRALLAWNGHTIVKVAKAIYDEQRFEDLPVLADALEEAGCMDQEILGHLRMKGAVHVRGCWVLDWILGKTRGQVPTGEPRQDRVALLRRPDGRGRQRPGE